MAWVIFAVCSPLQWTQPKTANLRMSALSYTTLNIQYYKNNCSTIPDSHLYDFWGTWISLTPKWRLCHLWSWPQRSQKINYMLSIIEMAYLVVSRGIIWYPEGISVSRVHIWYPEGLLMGFPVIGTSLPDYATLWLTVWAKTRTHNFNHFWISMGYVYDIDYRLNE